MEKYSKLKNHDELSHEIDRLKEEIQRKQMELSCLENMMFASDKDSSSKNTSSQQPFPSSSNRRKYSYESGSCQEGKLTINCGNNNNNGNTNNNNTYPNTNTNNLSGPNVCFSNGNEEGNSISFGDQHRLQTNDLESQLQNTVMSPNDNTKIFSFPLELSVGVQSSNN